MKQINRRRTKNVYVRFVPQLTNDWHGVNESYGRWIKHVIECGLLSLFAHFNRSFSHRFFSVCILLGACVCRCMWCSGSFSHSRCAAIVAFVFRLDLLGALLLCVWECAFFACVLVCSFSLSRCRCFIGLSFTTRLLCVYSFSTRVHVCAFICAVFRYCCSLSLMVCALQVSHRTQAYYCKVPHAIFYHAFDTEHTSSFMECDRFDWTDRASEGEWERWIVCVCWPNIYEKHRYISQHNNEKTEKNKWINTFRIVAQIIMVLVFKYHTQTTLLHTSRHWLTAANVLFAKRYIRTSHNQL